VRGLLYLRVLLKQRTEFPADALKRNVIRALERMGFRVLRETEHISEAEITSARSFVDRVVLLACDKSLDPFLSSANYD